MKRIAFRLLAVAMSLTAVFLVLIALAPLGLYSSTRVEPSDTGRSSAARARLPRHATYYRRAAIALDLVALVWRRPDHLDHETLDLRRGALRGGGTGTAVSCLATEVVTRLEITRLPDDPKATRRLTAGKSTTNSPRDCTLAQQADPARAATYPSRSLDHMPDSG
jgi:hypothetical protein